MKDKKGFTIIELVVVLVILAVIALIATPIVLNIIDKTTLSANKRSVDGYGKAIELAQSTYKLETGKYTYNFDELNVKYKGANIECDEIVLNENGSIFISKCKIDGEYIEDENTTDGYYQYGGVIFDYEVGDLITYNNVEYYVATNSFKSDKYITLLKAKPITPIEAKKILPSTELEEYIDLNSGNSSSFRMNYLYKDTCVSSGLGDISGCVNNYSVSSAKQVVDVWTKYYTKETDLLEDDLGYKSRLLTFDELVGDLGYKKTVSAGSESYGSSEENVLGKILGGVNSFYTMSVYEDYIDRVWVAGGGTLNYSEVYREQEIRPVINLKKSVIEE